MKKFFNFLLTLFLIVAASAVTTGYLLKHPQLFAADQVTPQPIHTPADTAKNVITHYSAQTDFTEAAESSVHAVVHVKTTIQRQVYADPFMEFFFGIPKTYQQPAQMASGSGVIISKDGYIVTNNHVIDKAQIIQVVLNDKREFEATLVGTDPNTDIALLKINTDSLPTIPFGNSDNLKVGEWVLAVGNPFNLTSTVTAGIVSAKARNINILQSSMKIESFIQTDAAVNPGNSGGALVNTRGELVGINTAIASQTGSYAGYSFAVPVSIVEKVVGDIKQFGMVQRAVLGVQIMEITPELQKERNLPTLQGVFIAGVVKGGAADRYGINRGDIITHIDGRTIRTVTDLQEQIGRHHPGDKVEISLLRNGKAATIEVELTKVE